MAKRIPVSIAVALLVSAAGAYLAFRHVPFGELLHYARRIDYRWALPSILVSIVSYLLRVVRWHWILVPSQPVPLSAAYHAMTIGFAVNCVLPARAGEIARPLVLRKTHQVPFLTSLSTVAAERLLDLGAVLVLLLVSLPSLGASSGHTAVFQGYELSGEVLAQLVRGVWAGLALLILGFLLVGWAASREAMLRLARRVAARLFPAREGALGRLVERALALLTLAMENAARGLLCFQRPSQLAGVLAATAGIWALNVACLYLLALGCPGIHIGMREMTFVLVAICLFIALPSVPGYWGVWEAGGVFALALYGVAATDAAGFVLLNHALQLLPVLAAGWYSSLRVGFRRSDLAAPPRHAGQGPA